MLQLFLQSIVTGLMLVTTFFGLRLLLRRAIGQSMRDLDPGDGLHCIQPLDLTEH